MEVTAPTLVWSPHPLLPGADRQCRVDPFLPGETLLGYLERLQLPIHAPIVVSVGHKIVSRDEWSATVLRDGDLVACRAALEKGNAGLLLSIGLSIAAPYAAGAILGTGLAGATAFSVLGQTVTWGGLLSGVISIAGNALIGGLFSPSPPKLQQASGVGIQESPTYSISGGQNRARPFSPLPLVVGRHRIFPDLAAAPYQEIHGDEQYLYQALNFGLSDITLSDIKIGQTSISQYQDVIIQESDSSGALTLFPGNVDSVQGGGVLTTSSGWAVRSSSINSTALSVDVIGLAHSISKHDGSLNGAEVEFEAWYRVVPGGSWQPFFSNGPNTKFIHVKRAPYRRSFFRTVSLGQYEVQMRLVGVRHPISIPDPDDFALSDQDHTWQTLRSYQPDTASYFGQKRIAVRIRASAQIQGSIEAVSALATGRCESWTGSSWVLTANRNPAWWYRWFALGKFDGGGRRLFGAGLPSIRIDEDGIKAWGAWCDANSLTCDLVVDQSTTVVEVLRSIARCGRAVDTWASGKLGVAYDEPNRPVTQVFGPGNIVAGTFAIEYLTGKLPDEIVATFINPALDWQQDTVRVVVPGVTDPANPATVDLFGTVDPGLAAREANLLAARQFFHPRRVTWESDAEALVCQRGDVVALSHDLTQWGYSGRLLGGTTTALTLDRTVVGTMGQDHYVMLRHPDGSNSLHSCDDPGAGSTTLANLSPALSAAPGAGGEDVRDWIYLFDASVTPGKRLKILDMQPMDERHVRLLAQDEDPDYYAAEYSGAAHVISAVKSKIPTLSDLVISETLVRLSDSIGVELDIAWTVTGDYGRAHVRIGANGAALETVAETTRSRVTVGGLPLSGIVVVEVVGFSARGYTGPAARLTTTYVLVGLSAAPGDVPWSSIDGTTLSWGEVPDVDVIGYRWRWQQGTRRSWGDANPLHEGIVTESPWTPERLPEGTVTLMVKAVDSSGIESEGISAIVVDLGDAIVANVIESQDEHADGFLGTITGSTVDVGSGDLEADDASGLMWDASPSRSMWAFDPTVAMYASSVYKSLVYEWSVTPTLAQTGSHITISRAIVGQGYFIEYRRRGADPMWTTDGADMWAADSDTLLWLSGATDYEAWPGTVIASNAPYDFRLSASGGGVQTTVSALEVIIDVPDILERFDDVAIDAAGTRLSLTKSYNVIRNVSLTLQDDAGTSETVRAMDKNATSGPLIQCFNAIGVGVDGTIDATIQGY